MSLKLEHEKSEFDLSVNWINVDIYCITVKNLEDLEDKGIFNIKRCVHIKENNLNLSRGRRSNNL